MNEGPPGGRSAQIDDLVRQLLPTLGPAPFPTIVEWHGLPLLRQHWHYDRRSGDAILADVLDHGLAYSQWLNYKIHDWVHLLHLAIRPSLYLRSDAVATFTLEALAMYMERLFLAKIDQKSEFPPAIRRHRDELENELSFGMVERSLRLDMDFEVHGPAQVPYVSWLEATAGKYRLDSEFVHSCVAPVHGFPGYGSCYCLGQELLDQQPQRAANIVCSDEDVCFDDMVYRLR